MAEINDLPAEMLMRVQSLLSPQDMKEAVLVCQLWRSVGEDPSLWDWCTLTVSESDHIIKLAVKRAQNVHVIAVNADASWQAHDWATLFQATCRLNRLKKIDGLRYARNSENMQRALECLPEVEPHLFAQAMAHLEEVDLMCTYISITQIQAFFMSMSQNSRIKKLNIGFNNLSCLESDLFAKILNSLENVKIRRTFITNEQLRQLFTYMSQNTKLVKLDISFNNLSSLEPDLFGIALSRLTKINLLQTGITKDQIESFFSYAARSNQLKKMDISWNNMSSLDSWVFAKVVAKLEVVKICASRDMSITNNQANELFRLMSQDTQLKKLYMFSNLLFPVEPELFAKVLCKLEDVRLERTSITTEQINALLTKMSESSQIRKLNLNQNNISLINPETLASVLIQIEEVELELTSITTEQILAIRTQISQDSRLKRLNLGWNKF